MTAIDILTLVASQEKVEGKQAEDEYMDLSSNEPPDSQMKPTLHYSRE